MADYRKSLMDMTPEERAEVAPGAVISDDVSTPLSVQAADAAVSLTTPIDSIVEIQEELKKENPDYLKIGMLGGIEAISLLAPGAGKAAQSMIRKGADMARQTDNVVDVASNVPKVAKEPFKKTRPAYKLFVKGEDGKLYPLFVNASDEIPVNEWLEADFPDVAFKGKTQKGGEGWYVPTKGAKRTKGEKAKATGDRIVIPDEETRQKLIDAGFITEKTGRTKDAPYGKVTAVAARPGFHSSVNPVAEHLGPQDIKVSKAEADKLIGSGINPKAIRRRGDQYYVKRRAEDQYWAEVEMADDTSDELRAYMESQGRTDINDKVPKGGSYSYVDGQADGDTWVVGGDMRVKKVLTREEAKAAQEAAGVKDLPYRDEVEAILGRKFAEGGLAGEDMYTGQQDYLLAASSGEEMSEGGSVEKQTEAMFKSSRGYAEGGSPKPRNRWETLKQWWATEKKEDEDEASAFDRFLESFMGDPIERGMRKKKQGAYKFAEGGEVGAAPDTTIGVDPVSGNEVPMGATPEEVRDDIPAQLSEGEYVVPADVVRFYGVKFFEDLRTEAKQGYAEMDQNGRIGGEPVEPEGMEMVEPEDDLPFDISELQVVDDETGMYEGGLTGYAEGGLELPNAPAATPVPANPFSPTGGGGFEIREYVNAAGQVMYIQFMNGQPMTFIPDGFSPKGTAAQQVSAEATEATSNQSSSRDDDDDPTMPQQEAKTAVDWNKATADDFATGIKGLGMSGAFGTIAGGLVGGPIGMAVGIGAKSAARYKAYDMLSGIDYQLESMSSDDPNRALLESQKQKLEEFVYTGDDGKSDEGIIGKSGIFGGKSSMYENLQDSSGDGRVTFQDTWLGDLLGGDGKLGVQGPSLAASRKGARRGEIADVSDKAITAVEKDTGKSVSVSAAARDKSDAGSRVSSASRSASAAQAYGKAATGSKYIMNSDGSTRKVTTYDKDKVKDIKFNPGGR